MKYFIIFMFASLTLTCPDDDELCLSCNMKTCLMCSGSYVDPTSGKCKKPSESIPNCI